MLTLFQRLDTILLGGKPIATPMARKRTIFIGKGYIVTMKEITPIHWGGEKYNGYYNCQKGWGDGSGLLHGGRKI